MTNWSVTWQNVLSHDRLYYHIKDLIVTWQDVLSYDGFDFHITDWVVTWRAGFSDDRLDYHWTGSLMIHFGAMSRVLAYTIVAHERKLYYKLESTSVVTFY